MQSKGRKNAQNRGVQSASTERNKERDTVKPDGNFDEVVCGARMQLNTHANRKTNTRTTRPDNHDVEAGNNYTKPRSGSAVVRRQNKELASKDGRNVNKPRSEIPTEPPELQINLNYSDHENDNDETTTDTTDDHTQGRFSSHRRGIKDTKFPDMVKITQISSNGTVQKLAPFSWLEEKCNDPLFHLSQSCGGRPYPRTHRHTCDLGDIEFEWNTTNKNTDHKNQLRPERKQNHNVDEHDYDNDQVEEIPNTEQGQRDEQDKDVLEPNDHSHANELVNERYIPFHHQTEIKRENLEMRKKLDEIKGRPNKHAPQDTVSKLSNNVAVPRFSEQQEKTHSDMYVKQDAHDPQSDNHGQLIETSDCHEVGMHRRHHKCQHPDEGKPVVQDKKKRKVNLYKHDRSEEPNIQMQDDRLEEPCIQMQQQQPEEHLKPKEQHHQQRQQQQEQQQKLLKRQENQQREEQQQQRLQQSQQHQKQHQQQKNHHQQQEQQSQQHLKQHQRQQLQHKNNQQQQRRPQQELHHQQQAQEQQQQQSKQKQQQKQHQTSENRQYFEEGHDEDVLLQPREEAYKENSGRNGNTQLMETRDDNRYRNRGYDTVGIRELSEHTKSQQTNFNTENECRVDGDPLLNIRADEKVKDTHQSKPFVAKSYHDRMEERLTNQVRDLQAVIRQMKAGDTTATKQEVTRHKSSHQVIDSSTYCIQRNEDFFEETGEEAIIDDSMSDDEAEQFVQMRGSKEENIEQVAENGRSSQEIGPKPTSMGDNISTRRAQNLASDDRIQNNSITNRSVNISGNHGKRQKQTSVSESNYKTQNQVATVKEFINPNPSEFQPNDDGPVGRQRGNIAFTEDYQEYKKPGIQNSLREEDDRSPSFVYVNVEKCPSSSDLDYQTGHTHYSSDTTIGESVALSPPLTPRPLQKFTEPMPIEAKQPTRKRSKRHLLLPFLLCCTQDVTIPSISTLASIERNSDVKRHMPSSEPQRTCPLKQQFSPTSEAAVDEPIQTDVQETRPRQRQDKIRNDKELPKQNIQQIKHQSVPRGKYWEQNSSVTEEKSCQAKVAKKRPHVLRDEEKSSVNINSLHVKLNQKQNRFDQPQQQHTAKQTRQKSAKGARDSHFLKGKAKMDDRRNGQQAKPLEERRKDARMYGTVKHHQKVQKDNEQIIKRIKNMDNKVDSWNTEKQPDNVMQKTAQFGTKEAHERAQQEYAAEKKRLKQVKPRVDARQSDSMERHLNASLAVIQDVKSTINPPAKLQGNRVQAPPKKQAAELGYHPSWADKQTGQNRRSNASKRTNQHGEYHLGMTAKGFLYKTYIPK